MRPVKRLCTLVSVLVSLAFFAPFSAMAQDAPETESTAKAEADSYYQAALIAFDEGDYEKALFELDKAWRLDRNMSYLYQRILVLEAMGKTELALELLESNRESLLDTAGVNDLFVVEERLKEANRGQANAEPKTEEPVDEPSRSALNWAGPIALTAVGIGLTIWGVTFFSGDCAREVQGECLVEEEAQTGTGIALVGAGAASIVGAIIWFVMTSPDSSPPATSAGLHLKPDGFVWKF